MEPKCFVCNNCNLVCLVYEEALRRGYEADWHPIGENGLCVVDVSYNSEMAFVHLVADVRVILARSGQIELPVAA